MAMFGRQPAFGLKSVNIPDENIASIETEDDLMEALGTENNVEEYLVEQEVLPTDDEIQLVSVPTDLEMQSLENIPFVIATNDDNETCEDDNEIEIIDDPNNSSMEGCEVCQLSLDRPSRTDLCGTCEACCHIHCLKPSSEAQDRLVCTLCFQKEMIDKERRGTKRKQEQQAQEMLAKSARRYRQAKVGDLVMVHLSRVDRGHWKFPNIHAAVIEINEA